MADMGSQGDQISASANGSQKPQEEKTLLPAKIIGPNAADALKKAVLPDLKRKKRRRRRRKPSTQEGLNPLMSGEKIRQPQMKTPLNSAVGSQKKEQSRFQPMETDETVEQKSIESSVEPDFSSNQQIESPYQDERIKTDTTNVPIVDAPVLEEVPSILQQPEPIPPSLDAVESEVSSPPPITDEAITSSDVLVNPPAPQTFPSSEPEIPAPSLDELDPSYPEPTPAQSSEVSSPTQLEPSPELPTSPSQEISSPLEPLSSTNNQIQPSVESEQAPKLDYQYQYQYSDKPSVYEIGQDQSLYPSDGQPLETAPLTEGLQPVEVVREPSDVPSPSFPAGQENIQIDATENQPLETFDQHEQPFAQPSSQEVSMDEDEKLEKEAAAQKAKKLADELLQKQDSSQKKEKGDGFFTILQKMVGFLSGFLKRIFGVFAFIIKIFGKIGSFFAGVFSFKRIAVVVFMVVILGGAYLIYVNRLPQKAYVYIVDLITPKTPPKIEVKVDEIALNQIGINSVLLFADNRGSVNDRIPSQIMVVDFFGHLLEPKAQGETGISGVTYYGELKDLVKDINEFVVYLQNLEKLQSLYSIDVYQMLDQSTARDKVLLKYLEDLKNAKTKSIQLYQQMGINVDDLKASYESLNPEKTRYETDFFTSLQALQSEKSDALLKGFTDIVQKQAALKARINALAKVIDYYKTALDHLDKRIEAVDKNKEALIQGIHVIDVPGGGIDIIIKP